MDTIEFVLLIIAYTLLILTLFLQFICYKRNLEPIETIALTGSLLVLIIALSVSSLMGHSDTDQHTNLFLLLAMILVALTTPLNALKERQHQAPRITIPLVYGFSSLMTLLSIGAFFIDKLTYMDYVVAIYLGSSIAGSMIFIHLTKPVKKIKYREKAERIFAVTFSLLIPIYLFAVYSSENHEIDFGLILPLVFIFLAGNKLIDDLNRLSLINPQIDLKKQHFKNYALTEREKEIATLLTKGATYKEITAQLHISMPTVKTHASNIYKKCGVKSRSELTALLIN